MPDGEDAAFRRACVVEIGAKPAVRIDRSIQRRENPV